VKIKNAIIDELLRSNALRLLRSYRNLIVSELFDLSLLLSKYAPIEKAYYVAREALIDKYAMKDDKGKRIRIDKTWDFGDNTAVFLEEFKKLLEIETDINHDRVKISMDSIPAGMFTPDEITTLRPLIEFTKGVWEK